MLEKLQDYIRVTLYILLVIVSFLLFQAWEKDHPKPELPVPVETKEMPSGRYIPQATDTAVSAPAAASMATAAQSGVPSLAAPPAMGKLIKVTTDVLEVTIDTRGGDIIEAKLLKYPESLGSKTPFSLLNDDAKSRYIAESGLLSKLGPDTPESQALYTSDKPSYTLNPGENDLTVRLDWQKDGVKVSKVFTFIRDSYEVKVGYEIINQSQQTWEGNLYTQLMRTDNPPPSQGGFVNLATYFGAAVSTPQKPFQKVTFKEMHQNNLNLVGQDGWAAMIQHYFITAWIPPKTATSTYYSRVTPNGLYTIGMIGPALSVAPGSKFYTESKLYTGPAIADRLEKAAPNLQLTIDFGWFWFISVAISG